MNASLKILICMSMSLLLASCSGGSSFEVLKEKPGVDNTPSKDNNDSDNTDNSTEPSPSPSPTPTPSPTPDPSPSPSPTPTPSPTPDPSPSPSPTPTPSPTPDPSPSPSPTPTPSPSPEPSPSPSPSPTPTPTPPVTTCPDAYEKVAANSALSTAEFCIAKFEMKKTSSNTAESKAADKPWLANKATASSACTSLGAGYRLPTNAEWNATALEIYNQNSNWTGGTKLQGTLMTGFYSGWTEPIAITNTSNAYDGTGRTSGSERRTFVLASGNTLWDFGGNAWEWVSDTIYGNSYTPDLSGTFIRAYHNNNWDMAPNSPQLIKFTAMSSVPTNDVYLGQFWGGSSGKVIRGGAVCIHPPGNTGIFAANIGDITANEAQAPASWNLNMNNIGFRCVKELSQ